MFSLKDRGDNAGNGSRERSDSPDCFQSYSPIAIQVTDPFLERFNCLSCDGQVKVLRDFLHHHCSSHYDDLQVPGDFLQLSLAAMKNLQKNQKPNVLHSLAKGLGLMRADCSDSYFPMRRMPFGLLEYIVSFFTSNPGANV